MSQPSRRPQWVEGALTLTGTSAAMDGATGSGRDSAMRLMHSGGGCGGLGRRRRSRSCCGALLRRADWGRIGSDWLFEAGVRSTAERKGKKWKKKVNFFLGFEIWRQPVNVVQEKSRSPAVQSAQDISYAALACMQKALFCAILWEMLFYLGCFLLAIFIL